MGVDDLPTGGRQVVAGVGYLQVTVDRPGAGAPAQVDQEVVRVVEVFEPVARGEHVEIRQLLAARGMSTVERRTRGARAYWSGIHRVVSGPRAAGGVAQLAKELTLPAADV